MKYTFTWRRGDLIEFQAEAETVSEAMRAAARCMEITLPVLRRRFASCQLSIQVKA